MLGDKLITVELTKYSSWLINSNYARFNLKYNYITNPEFNAVKNKFGISHNEENLRKLYIGYNSLKNLLTKIDVTNTRIIIDLKIPTYKRT